MKDKIVLNSYAVELRKKIGEDMASPIDIFSVINNIPGFTLVFYPLSNKISGLCIKTNNDENLIAINSTLSYGRQRFTAAHELYHLYFQEEFTKVICGMDIGRNKDVEEKNADAFASYFLAPYDALRMYIADSLKTRSIALSDVVKIEQHFGMSRQATLYRLCSDDYITAEFAETLKSNVILSARRLGYDDKLYTPTQTERQYMTTGSYIGLAEQLKEKEIISQGKYEEFLLDAYRFDIVYNLSAEGEEKYD